MSSSPGVFETDDTTFPFEVGGTAVKGRIVRLGPAIDRILSAHRFPAAVSMLVGEAAALVALMGASLKFDGKLILQAKGDGPLSLLVADYSADGGLRATATLNGDIPKGPAGLPALMGAGHLALTIDQGPDMERYQGVTPLDGGSLAAAAAAYFVQSEQIPTAVKLAVGRFERPGLAAWRAGGVIVQFVPAEGGLRQRGEAALKSPEEEDAWTRAAAHLATTRDDELLDPGVSSEELLYRLYHEDGVRVFERKRLAAVCGCSAAKIEAVLQRYDPAELSDMLEDGAIRVACEFCRTEYRFDDRGREIAA
jgi:molecular chaperone Hsp33